MLDKLNKPAKMNPNDIVQSPAHKRLRIDSCNSPKSNTTLHEPFSWPDSDEDSFLSDIKLSNELNESKTQQDLFTNDGHDSLFSDIKIDDMAGPSSNNDDETLKEFDDSLFKDIEPPCNAFRQSEDLMKYFDDDIVEDLNVQNTQKFLDDIAFKVPKQPVTLGLKEQLSSSIAHHFDMTNFMQGTQYETREEIKNRTIGGAAVGSSFRQDEQHLSAINWETQGFPEDQPIDEFPSRGDFYGLPGNVKKMIFEHKGIKSLYEWQDECLNLPAIRKRKNLLYALPTSGGKTLVAEILMLREIICREKHVLFILPYVSIVQEKVSAMAPFALGLNFIVEEYTAGKGRCPPPPRKKRRCIFIGSIEKGAVLFDSLIEAGRANEIGLVVVDELHLIGEKGRGATLEAFLTKVMYINASIQIVGMSATIGNLPELSDFLDADVYTRGFRPVELKEYIKCGCDILEINTAGSCLEEIFVYKRTVNFKYSAQVAKSDPDHLAGLVSEVAPKESCLIFCSTRKNCENVAVLLSRVLPKSKFIEYRKSEKADLMDALDKICGILSPILEQTIPYGIAYHHSGLTIDERKMLETAYRIGTISVICCTSTLAAGVNLPAKRVIIRAPYVGMEFMNLCKYKQMVGRAGRAGMGDAGESILICASKDNIRVGEMLFSPMDKVLSSLDHNDGIGLQTLILSSIGLGLADCLQDLINLNKNTLMSVQSEKSGVSVRALITSILRQMFKHKVLQLKDTTKGSSPNSSDILTTQEMRETTSANLVNNPRQLVLCKTTRFELTTIGKAAFKAGIDYKKTNLMYKELKNAQKSMVLSNYSHLLYLVVSFNSSENGEGLFTVNPSVLFREYTKLDENTQCLFKVLGITEAHAAKMAKTMSTKGPMEVQLSRLYKVLILLDVLNLMPLHLVATKFSVERGMLQTLVNQSVAAASALVRLCEQVEEFWCYKPLFEKISGKMDRCGTLELEPLLDLPAVKINRAKQFYTAGFKTIEDIAKCKPMQLAKKIEHLSFKAAKEIISAAKLILMKKLDTLQEETEAILSCFKNDDNDLLPQVT
ncbi:helicase POLQ-like isoform X1 [Episyrphus balteatus]|uniref:helicase POLQ-like isoform X1 n=1 Tax=Episyrphus balteatus TaxID=286459 RepID=UPI002484E48C|nr:helicase POLQ-like isoform X1 [Episyrphus balteatus]